MILCVYAHTCMCVPCIIVHMKSKKTPSESVLSIDLGGSNVELGSSGLVAIPFVQSIVLRSPTPYGAFYKPRNRCDWDIFCKILLYVSLYYFFDCLESYFYLKKWLIIYLHILFFKWCLKCVKSEFSFRLAKISFEFCVLIHVSVFLSSVNYINGLPIVFLEHEWLHEGCIWRK